MKDKLGNLLGILSISSVVLYAVFFSLSRKQFTETFLLYFILFILFYGLYRLCAVAYQKNYRFLPSRWGYKLFSQDVLLLIFIAGLVIRGTLLTYTPNLSQDFFRFIWDGNQLLQGYNPYLYLPDDVMKGDATHIPQATLLHLNMGELSSSHYSNYPPFNQLFFAVAAFLGGKSIIATMMWMRVMIILADVGIFIWGIKLLRILKLPQYYILLYFLNPFVIIELTGNLHFEGVMAFFMLLGIYFILKSQLIKSSLFLACGVLVKLLPVIILPLLFKKLQCKKAVYYYLAIGVFVVIGFVPFYNHELLPKYASTVGLWFHNFEFNASTFYIVRAIGYEVTGYNVIETAGFALSLFTFCMVLLLSFKRQNQQPQILISSIVLSFFIYLLFSTTVHPWYLTIPLLFSIFTRYRFMLVWSFMVFISYQAYSNIDYMENMWLLGIEYGVVMIVFLWDINFFTKNTTAITGK
jgi:hypothetical protein